MMRKMYQDMVLNKGAAPKDKPIQIQGLSRKKNNDTPSTTASFGD